MSSIANATKPNTYPKQDIKSSNILITNKYQLRLADFGLVRSTMASDGKEFRADFTNNVVTMWYKSPELLLGSVKYSYPVDVWSAGCENECLSIFYWSTTFSSYCSPYPTCLLSSTLLSSGVVAELELHRPLFPGKTELEELDMICRSLGTPGEESWSGIKSLPEYSSLLEALPRYSSTFTETFRSKISPSMLQFLERILIPDPNKRFSSKACIESSYFVTQPVPELSKEDVIRLSSGTTPCTLVYPPKSTKKSNLPWLIWFRICFYHVIIFYLIHVALFWDLVCF